jgi:hypothetical protein
VTGGPLEAWGLSLNGAICCVVVSCDAHTEIARHSVVVPTEGPRGAVPKLVRLAHLDLMLAFGCFQCVACLEAWPVAGAVYTLSRRGETLR